MDPRILELHCIMPMGNTPSVLRHGILSFERAAALLHHSVAMPDVQERRDQKQVPGGLRLHQYANLYFHARNPMLFKRLDQADTLCVIRVDREVMRLPGVVLSDQNAASDYVRFRAFGQISEIDMDRVYAADWRHQDRIIYYRQKAAKCAEVLVPERVEPRFLIGGHVVDAAARDRLTALGFSLPIEITPSLFFR
jgi:ssDNA thymidine ADP-ribosyltransferase, DarT